MDFEERVRRVYNEVLRDGDLAVDVGAHRGLHTLPMARAVAPGGRVWAFEPLPACRRELVAALGNEPGPVAATVSVCREALSDFVGAADYVVAVDAPAYSGLRRRTYDVPTRLETMRVDVTTLDDVFGECDGLRFIKIDAEGGEYHILRGAHRCLRRYRPLICFEFGANAIAEYGVQSVAMATLLRRHGYRIYDILGDDVTEPAWFIASARRQEVWDYVAVPAGCTPPRCVRPA